MYPVTADKIRDLHDELIRQSGGSPGVLSIGTLDHIAFECNRRQDIFTRAAMALHGVVTMHPFFDGNKRTCLALAYVILRGQGYKLQQFNEENSKAVWYVLNTDHKKQFSLNSLNSLSSYVSIPEKNATNFTKMDIIDSKEENSELPTDVTKDFNVSYERTNVTNVTNAPKTGIDVIPEFFTKISKEWQANNTASAISPCCIDCGSYPAPHQSKEGYGRSKYFVYRCDRCHRLYRKDPPIEHPTTEPAEAFP